MRFGLTLSVSTLQILFYIALLFLCDLVRLGGARTDHSCPVLEKRGIVVSVQPVPAMRRKDETKFGNWFWSQGSSSEENSWLLGFSCVIVLMLCFIYCCCCMFVFCFLTASYLKLDECYVEKGASFNHFYLRKVKKKEKWRRQKEKVMIMMIMNNK